MDQIEPIVSTKKLPLNDYLHSYGSSTVLSVVIKINSLCCTCQPDAVCVQQSLSSTALVVWVQCSRAGSKSVSTTMQHHGRNTQDGTCSKYKGFISHFTSPSVPTFKAGKSDFYASW